MEDLLRMTKITFERTRLEQMKVSLEIPAGEPGHVGRRAPDETGDVHGSSTGSRPDDARRLVESRRLTGKTDA